MTKTMTYKGYTGSVERSEEDGIFFGKVLGIRSLLLYEGNTAEELEADFHEFVDDYLQTCKENGVEPEKPFQSPIFVNVSPDIYKKASLYALEHSLPIDSLIDQAIANFVAAG